MGGRQRAVIVQAPKNGFFYVLDRRTGELLSAEAFADDLRWASTVDLASGRPVETPEARYGQTGRGAYLAPGPLGAHNWHPMAWNAATGLVYLPAQNNDSWYEKTERLDYRAGQWNTGTVRGGGGAPPVRPPLRGPRTLLLAWDPAEGREVWRLPGDGANGGALSTAGDLVFWGTGSRLVALHAGTSAELWSAEVGSGPATPVTWALDGRQHVTIAAGSGREGDPPRVWTFALGGGG